ncbi:MAG TPA: AAA family ATPase [Gemmataceae bacterium]|nr:AAA family ATPase [Gemmataceae bacterium]
MSQSGPQHQPDNLPVPQGNRAVPAPGVPLAHGFGALTPLPPPSLSPKPNLLALLIALRQRWALALVLGLLAGAAVGAATWYLLPPMKYNAQARVYLESKPMNGSGKANGSDWRNDILAFQKTQTTVVKSRFVLSVVLKDPNVTHLGILQEHQADAPEWLSKEIVADFSAGPEILSISLAGDEPKDLVTLVDAVMQAYLDEFVNRENKQRTKQLDHLRKWRVTQEGDLKQLQVILEKFAPKVGFGDSKGPNGQREVKKSFLEQMRSRLVAVQIDLVKFKGDIESQEEERKKVESGSLPATIVNQSLNNDPVVQSHLAIIAELERKIEINRPNIDPAKLMEVLKGTFAQLQSARDALEARRKVLVEKKKEELTGQVLAELDKNLEISKHEQLRLAKEEEVLNKVIAELGEETRTDGIDQLGMAQAQKEYDREAKLLDELNANIRALEFSASAETQVLKIDDAIATKVNDPKQRMLVAGGAGVAGLFLALFAVALWEFFARRVKSVDEVAFGLNVRLIGTLPAMPASSRGRRKPPTSAAHVRWQNLFTESVDSYRTMLLHEAQARSAQVVMVSSAVSGEGKTSLACHLAVSLARAGYNTLLIDGDLRNPSAHRVFGLTTEPGLCELLRGEVDLAAAVRPCPTGGTWILTAGKSDLRSIQCLNSEALRATFQEIREQFDFVIVDSSPVLSVADSLLIAKHVDGVIFSVLCDVSRLPKLTAAQHRLAMLGVPTLGAVVIGTSEEAYSPKYHWPVPA